MSLGLGQAPGAAFPWRRDRSCALQPEVGGSSRRGSHGGHGEPGHARAAGSPSCGHSPAQPVPWEGTLGTRRVPRHLRLSRWAAGFAAGPAWHGGLRAAAQPLRQLGSPHPRLASGT